MNDVADPGSHRDVKRARRLAWTLWGLFVVVLGLTTYAGFNPPLGEAISVIDAIWAASFLGFPTAGALVAPRMPRRPLGWMLLGAPLALMIALALGELSRFFLNNGESTAAIWSWWVSSVVVGLALTPLLLILVYLPSGSLPSVRWRGVARLGVGVTAASTLHAAFRPGPLETAPEEVLTRNPLGLTSLAGVFGVLDTALGFLYLSIVVLGVASLIFRFRGSRGLERQQVKWLALGGAGILVPIAAITLIEAFVRDLSDQEATVFIVFAILSMPAAISVAVMKTRLYDIDVIVNRTLVYGSLTGILALAYFGVIVLLQRVLGPLTQQSDLSVAGSTLVVAALFRPLRTRVQSFIDHRFYRRKYDAVETLGAFTSRLREQVDLDSLSQELLGAVRSTMQPTHTSLWLRAGSVE